MRELLARRPADQPAAGLALGLEHLSAASSAEQKSTCTHVRVRVCPNALPSVRRPAKLACRRHLSSEPCERQLARTPKAPVRRAHTSSPGLLGCTRKVSPVRRRSTGERFLVALARGRSRSAEGERARLDGDARASAWAGGRRVSLERRAGHFAAALVGAKGCAGELGLELGAHRLASGPSCAAAWADPSSCSLSGRPLAAHRWRGGCGRPGRACAAPPTRPSRPSVRQLAGLRWRQLRHLSARRQRAQLIRRARRVNMKVD